MTAIFALIENTEKMRKYLFWYLMIIPALLLLWIVLGAANSQMDFQAALKIPFFTVAFLNACLSLLLGGTLKLAGAENERTERAYALYLTILLVIIGNLPGAILSFFLFRSLRFGNLEGELAPKYRWALLPALVFYVLVTVVLLVANIAVSTRRIKHIGALSTQARTDTRPA